MDSSGDWVELWCPYCGERLELTIDPMNVGTMIEDCEVCCNPCRLTIRRDEYGDPEVTIERTD